MATETVDETVLVPVWQAWVIGLLAMGTLLADPRPTWARLLLGLIIAACGFWVGAGAVYNHMLRETGRTHR